MEEIGNFRPLFMFAKYVSINLQRTQVLFCDLYGILHFIDIVSYPLSTVFFPTRLSSINKQAFTYLILIFHYIPFRLKLPLPLPPKPSRHLPWT